MQFESVKHIAQYYKAIPGMLRLLQQEREELEAALLENGLRPAGVLCSHSHVDHCANNRYFQENGWQRTRRTRRF